MASKTEFTSAIVDLVRKKPKSVGYVGAKDANL
jgi:hypothetical protein